MNTWSELQGGRGSNEIASCLWKYIETNYEKTATPRHLVIWFDRCVGQNNNRIVLTTMMKLARASYFTTIHQKFFVTGHSYNSCDRSFGIIEGKMRMTELLTPTAITDLIREAAQENPFSVQEISQNAILDFKKLSGNVKFPSYFKITKQLWYSYSTQVPDLFGTRTSHDPTEPTRMIPVDFGFEFSQRPEPQNTGVLMIEQGKLNDLRKLLEFLKGEEYAYYDTLIQEQLELRQEMQNSDP